MFYNKLTLNPSEIWQIDLIIKMHRPVMQQMFSAIDHTNEFQYILSLN